MLAGFLLGVLIISMASFVLGQENSTTTSTSTTTTANECKNLYWFDDSSKECGYKEFCAMYMYKGLNTFATKDECEKSFKDKETETSVEETDFKMCSEKMGYCANVYAKCKESYYVSENGIAECNSKSMNCCLPEAGKEVSEQTKCIFKNSPSKQTCYTADDNSRALCSDSAACSIEIKGHMNEKITWKSSCGGYGYTILDGKEEVVEFECKGGETPALEIKNKGFENVYFQCQDGEESKSTEREACKTSEYWQKFAENFCKSHCAKKGDVEKCGVNSFSVNSECYLEDDEDCSLLNCADAYYDKEKKQCMCGNTGSTTTSSTSSTSGGTSSSTTTSTSATPTETQAILPNDVLVCKDACPLDGKCYVFGYRKSGKFCSDSGTFIDQLKSAEKCENAFECQSGLCIDNKCISEGFFKKIMKWFSNLFGGEN